MTTTERMATVAVVWLIAGSSVFAHPGHGRGGGDFSILHYLTEPEHLFVAIPMLLIVAAAAAYAIGIVRPRSRDRS